MVKIIDVGQTMRAPGLYRVAKDYVIKERVNVNPYSIQLDNVFLTPSTPRRVTTSAVISPHGSV